MPATPHEESDTMEEIIGTYYFFTITLNPLLYGLTLRQQFRKSVNKLIDKLLYYEEWKFAVEITPKNGNLHFHGIIKMSGKEHIQVCLFKDKFKGNKIFGFTQCDKVKDMDKSYHYITKDVVETNIILNGDPTDLNYNSQKEVYPVYFEHQNKYKNYQETMFNRVVKKIKNKNDTLDYNQYLDKDTVNDPLQEVFLKGKLAVERTNKELEEVNKLLNDVRFYATINRYKTTTVSISYK